MQDGVMGTQGQENRWKVASQRQGSKTGETLSQPIPAMVQYELPKKECENER